MHQCSGLNGCVYGHARPRPRRRAIEVHRLFPRRWFPAALRALEREWEDGATLRHLSARYGRCRQQINVTLAKIERKGYWGPEVTD